MSAPAAPLFLPKLWTVFRDGYSWKEFGHDAAAGLVVGIVALPLAIAFAIASGVTPERGLATAVVAGFLISALGGSRVQIGGPTGAFVVIVYAIVHKFGVDGLLVCTVMAGVMLILMGLAGLGTVIKFIPYPLTVGFTSGIAVIIFSQQVKDLLGLPVASVPAEFLGKWEVYFQHLHEANFHALGLTLFSLAVLLLWPRVSRRVPGSIIALVAATALAAWLDLRVETIGSRFGDLPHGLPWPQLPSVDRTKLAALVSPAFTVAILGAIESLLSATVADGMIEARHRSNTELIAQGIANVVSPLFGGLPATGAIARTATNVKNGGRTPVAGIIHALTLLLVVLAFGRWARYIPLCVLAAILVIVSYHMSEWRAFAALMKAPRSDVAVLVTTFGLTVLVDLTVAVEIGMLLALVLFVKRMTDVTSVREVTEELSRTEDEKALRAEPGAAARREIPPGVSVYEAEGAFFFGAASSLRDTFAFGAAPPKALILRMRRVVALDASGLRALQDLHRACAKAGTTLILSGAQPQPLAALKKGGILRLIGEENVVQTLDAALRRARDLAS